MLVSELMVRLDALGIEVREHDGKLKVSAPSGALTPDIVAALREHKADVLAALARGGDVPIGKSPVGDERPLAFAQRRLWFLHQLDEGASRYNQFQAVRLQGALDVAALRRSLTEIVRRHDALRTTFPLQGAAPVQKIAPSDDGEIALPVLQHAEADLPRLLRQEAERPFDLARGPLLRATLIQTEPERHYLVISMHHIVCDGWSTAVFVSELGALYDAFSRGLPASLPPLEIQYGDYAAWQNEQLASGRFAEQLAWWKQRCAGAPPLLQLPTDRPLPPVQTYAGASARFSLDAALTARIDERARASRASLFMVLFSAFAALLSRYSGQEDIVIGTPIAGRNRREIEPLIGVFINNLPLRVDLAERPSFAELIARVRTVALDAYGRQDVPFERIVEAINPPRDPSHTPIFQAMFILRHTLDSPPSLRGLDVTLLEQETRSADFLTLVVQEERPGLVGWFEYNTDVFDASTVDRMAANFQVLLDAALSEPDRPIGHLPLLTVEERRHLVGDWSGSAAEYPREARLTDLFEAQARRRPDAVALELEGTTWSYAELDARANRLARQLRAMGVGRGARVGIFLERSLDLLVGLLGTLKAGAAYVPLDPEYPAERLAFMIDDAALSALLTQGPLRHRLPPGVPGVVCLDLEWPVIAARSGAEPRSVGGPEDPAYVIYTSGSTGKPKGVVVGHRALVNFLCSMAREPGMVEDDVLLAVTTISFDIAGLELYLPLICGARVVLASREAASDGARLLGLLRDHRVSVMQATPATWRLLVAAGWRGERPLKVLCGGEALPSGLAAQLGERSDAVWSLYGPTETTIWSAVHRVRARHVGLSPDAPEPIGAPIANTWFYVLDSFRELTAIGVPGVLHIGGEGLAHGYLGRDQLTAERFIANPFGPGRLYDTGDLIRRLPDGTLEFLGRSDHQIKLRGFRIELGEIEAALAAHPAVREALAIVRSDRADDPRLVAYVALHSTVSAQALRAFVKDRLPAYMIPAAIVTLDTIPRTPNGKADRRGLPAPETDGLAAARAPLEDDVQRRIATIWCEVLGLSAVGADDNFFDLGGHSLLLMEVQYALQNAFAQDLSVIDLFRHPTIEALARFIRGRRDAETRVDGPFDPGLLARSAATRVPGIEREGNARSHPIAIIGMAGRFPGASDVETFWSNVASGVESIRSFTVDELLEAGVDPAEIADPRYVPANGRMDDIEAFDAALFGYSPREAETMDPQQRHFLECAFSVLEHAGYDHRRHEGRIGVFGGTGINTYLLHNLTRNPAFLASIGDYQVLIGNDKDFTPTRVSYKLDLRGPSVNVNTACSTSLVAVSLACQALIAGQCDMALAGASSIKARQTTGYRYQEGMILSPDGHCRAFDANAAGTVSGNGVGVVVLKRLEDALADGDFIHAVIRGSAINNDGSDKVGFLAPSLAGQAAVIAEAHAAAGISAETIQYVEGHGTATPLGDPIEVAALTQAFRKSTDKTAFCALGSVKTNIGHLDTAAGIAGLIKTVLALQHRQIPPSLHFHRPNPRLDLPNSPFYVNTELRAWPSPKAGEPRRAGVSAFGIGGTNVSLVVDEAPEQAASGPSRPVQLLLLSAQTPAALERATAQLSARLRSHPELPLADIAFTLAAGRRVFELRRAVVCSTATEAADALDMLDPKRVFTHLAPSAATRSLAGAAPDLVFMFPGQGGHHVGMGEGLYRDEPVFRAAVDRSAELLQGMIGYDLREILFPVPERSADAAARLGETLSAQVAVFVIEYALAQLWLSWGFVPRAMVGHSFGEYAAACVAGVFSLEGALALVAGRGRLSQELPPGGMMAVPLGELELHPLLGAELSLAAVNGPSACVMSGPIAALEALAARLSERGLEGRRLPIPHAFHSPALDPILDAFVDLVRRLDPQPPRVPFVSTLTGTWIRDDEATDPAFWGRHFRGTVRFHDALKTLVVDANPAVLEIGPGTALSTLARRSGAIPPSVQIVSSMRHPTNLEPDGVALMGALGKLWLSGVELDAARFYAAERRRRVPLPTYPFERLRYWVDATRGESVTPARPASKIAEIERWFYRPSWERSSLSSVAAKALDGCVVIFADERGLGEALADRLRAARHEVRIVTRGPRFEELSAHRFSVAPGRKDDHDALLDALRARGDQVRWILHCWSVTGAEDLDRNEEIERGCVSLMYLAQAIGREGTEERVDIVVFSDGLGDVTGDEPLRPAKATLVGAVKVIPQETPNVSCRSIDLAPMLGRPDPAQCDRLVEELRRGHADETVAYRGRHRWALRYVQVPVPEARPGRLRDGGVYLITGGLGGVGLEIARHLARTRRAKLVLTGRTPLPSREAASRGLRRVTGIDLRIQDEAATLADHEITLRERLGDPGLHNLLGLSERVNRLCTAHVARFWSGCGIDMRAGSRHTLGALREAAGVIPKFYRLFDECVTTLAQSGVIAREGDDITLLVDGADLAAPASLGAELARDLPSFQGVVTLLEHCIGHYPEVLRGDLAPIGVLYPDGDSTFMTGLLEGAAEHSSLEVYAGVLQELLLEALRRAGGRRLRILEIGGGTGKLTWRLAPLLQGRNATYCFTDITRAFVNDAEARARADGHDFLSFALCDITRDPVAQGFAPASFDLILGLDVVHATPRIAATITNLQRVLAPGGLVGLLESATVDPPRWFNLVWGLAEGWWAFEDQPLRSGSPLLGLESWDAVFQSCGFSAVLSFPRDSARRRITDMGLIVAQSAAIGDEPSLQLREHAEAEPALPADASARATRSEIAGAIDATTEAKIQAIVELEALGAEVVTLACDVSDFRQARAAVELAQQRFGALHGVIHAAAVIVQASVALKGRAQLDAELAPKLTGALALTDALVDVDLDFFALFSSISAVVGGPGQLGYVAANAFLDAFAHACASRSDRHVVAIDWDRWTGIGAARAFESWHQQRSGEALGDAMRVDEALDVFERILDHRPGPQIIISSQPLERVRDRTRAAVLSGLGAVPAAPGAHQRHHLTTAFVAPRSTGERAVAQVWSEILGVDRVGANDHFAELGGDSLIAVRIAARLRDVLGVSLSVRTLFEGPTVAEVARNAELAREEQDRSRGVVPAAAPPATPPPPRGSDGGPAPATFAQQRLWFLDRLEGPSATYNIPAALRLRGPLDRDVLARSLNEIARRHATLRTRIEEIDGRTAQVVAPDAELTLSTIALDAPSLEDRVQLARQWIAEDADRPFDLSSSPLVRVTLLELREADFVLALMMHHIIADGWSMGVLIRELATLYGAFLQGRRSPLPELPIQYADFARAQSEQPRSGELDSDLAFWRTALHGAPPLLQLLPDRPRPPVQGFEGQTAHFRVDPALALRLGGLGRASGASLFMVLLAGFLVLVKRYSGQEDLVIGAPVANRRIKEVEPLIGLFTNTLVLRTDASGDPAFEELLRRVREVALDAYGHADTPFERLVEAIHPERNLSYTPIVQVMFLLQDRQMARASLPGLHTEPFDFEVRTAKCDLTLAMQETDDGLLGSFIYRSALFDAAAIARAIDHFLNLLEDAARDPGKRLSELSMLTEAERGTIVREWGSAALECPRRTITGVFAEQTARHPDATAVVAGGRSLTYAELDHRANRLAHHLQALGVGPEVRVGLCVDRSIELIVGMLGILKAGGAYVPLDPAHPVDRVAYVCGDAGVAILVTQAALLDRLPPRGARVVCLDRDAAAIDACPDAEPARAVGPESLAYVIYTSGSTGRPKGIMIEHHSVVNLAAGLARIVGVGPRPLRVALVASTVFDASVQQIFGALLEGHELHVVDDDTRSDGAALLDHFRAHAIELSDCTPSLLLLLAEAGLASAPGLALRTLLCGGEALPRSLAARVATPGGALTLVNVYGPTECCVDNTALVLDARALPDEAIVPLGRPLPNARVYVLDPQGGPVPIGITGEICIAGEGVGRGYLDRPELTAARFAAAPILGEARLYRTGDRGRWSGSGLLEYLGRSDDQIKIRGHRIELGEIEARLREHPDTQDAVVVSRTAGAGHLELVAYLVTAAAMTVVDLRRYLAASLPEYMIPASFVLLDRFPLNASGKVDRAALPAPIALVPLDDGSTARAPEGRREQALVEVWEEVLERRGLGVTDDYFALGGDSIKALQIVSRLRQRKLKLQIRDLFRHRTVAELAPHLEDLAPAARRSEAVQGDAPLTPIQRSFLERFDGAKAHFNQAVVLAADERLDPPALRAALAAVQAHHDALRFRYRRSSDGGRWLQEHGGLEHPLGFDHVDLRARPEPAAALREHAAAAQASLDLGHGPLFRAILYHLPEGDRVLCFAHHLVIDAVSWGILVQDLGSAYRAAAAGHPIELPEKSTSFQEWGRRLERSASREALEEIPYWSAIERGGDEPLRLDFPAGELTFRALQEHRIRLSEAETEALLTDVHRAYNTEINDILLTALVRAFAAWHGRDRLVLTLEGHGREPLFDDLDVSRTVGWFTSLFPVALDITGITDVGQQIKVVKENLRALPHKGVRHGVLAELTEPSLRSGLELRLRPSVSFNYLGDVERGHRAGPLRIDAETVSGTVDPAARPAHELDCLAIIRERRFELLIGFSAARLAPSSIERLADAFIDALREIIAHTRSKAEAELTPSDVDYDGFTIEQLDDFLDSLKS